MGSWHLQGDGLAMELSHQAPLGLLYTTSKCWYESWFLHSYPGNVSWEIADVVLTPRISGTHEGDLEQFCAPGFDLAQP